jgi:thiol-disulfide isomerase/thioredoxin
MNKYYEEINFNMNRKFLIFILISLSIIIVTGPLVRHYSRITDIWVTHIVYFFAVFISIKYSSLPPKKVLLAYFLGFAIPLTLSHILEGMAYLFILNEASYIIAILSGYFFSVSNDILRKAGTVILSATYCLVAVLFLADKFLHYEGYKNFDGKVNEAKTTIGIIANSVDTMRLDGVDKFILLDFWTTRCGVCFQKFPKLQEAYDLYKNDKRVDIYAVNVPLPRDTALDPAGMIMKRGYTFPVYFATAGMETPLSIYGYPTALLIRNNNIIGRGSIENILKILEENLE